MDLRLRSKRFKSDNIITPSSPVSTTRRTQLQEKIWSLLVCLRYASPSSVLSPLAALTVAPCKRQQIAKLPERRFSQPIPFLVRKQTAKAPCEGSQKQERHGKPTTEEPRRAQHAGSILGRRARAHAAAGRRRPTSWPRWQAPQQPLRLDPSLKRLHDELVAQKADPSILKDWTTEKRKDGPNRGDRVYYVDPHGKGASKRYTRGPEEP